MVCSLEIKRKAFAYITNGSQLLVFKHLDQPEAGIQVPAGTIKADETSEVAALREAYEETGLAGLALVSFLGYQERDMSDYGKAEIHQRYFYHLRYEGAALELWQHSELDPSDGTLEPIVFELYWVAVPEGLPELIAEHGKFLDLLAERLKSENPS